MKFKNSDKINLISFTILFCVLLGFFATFVFQLPHLNRRITFSLIPETDSTLDLPADLLQWIRGQNFVLNLESPEKIWWQEQQQIRMNIFSNGLTSQSNSLFSKYNLFYEVRLDLNSAQLLSGNTIVEALDLKNPTLFLWDFKPLITEDLNGKVWVYFHITDPFANAHWQYTRLAIPIQIKVISFLGLSLKSVRIFLLLLAVILAIFLITRKFLRVKK